VGVSNTVRGSGSVLSTAAERWESPAPVVSSITTTTTTPSARPARRITASSSARSSGSITRRAESTQARTRAGAAADEIHGESGDDSIYGWRQRRLFGEGRTTTVGGVGNDWISGGTGDDGVSATTAGHPAATRTPTARR
jgi:Ca2+-binding RTX toxin-like protein